jgi:hypothetical protein
VGPKVHKDKIHLFPEQRCIKLFRIAQNLPESGTGATISGMNPRFISLLFFSTWLRFAALHSGYQAFCCGCGIGSYLIGNHVRATVATAKHLVGLLVAHETFSLGIEIQRASQTVRYIRQMHQRCGIVPLGYVAEKLVGVGEVGPGPWAC